MIEWIGWSIFWGFLLLATAAAVEIFIRNRKKRFPDYFTPILVLAIVLSTIYIRFF